MFEECLHKFSIFYDGYQIDKTVLYHYTSPEGLRGILENKTLHFTDAQFLNDVQECKDIFKHLKTLVDTGFECKQELLKKISEFALIALTDTEYFGADPQDENTFRFFVFCASTDPDNLSMWNYYTKSPSSLGFSIPIDWHEIHAQLWQSPAIQKLKPVYHFDDEYRKEWQTLYRTMYGAIIYDDKTKISLLKEIVSTVNSNYSEKVFESFKLVIRSLSAFFKNSAFQHEKEYRFVVVTRNKELNEFLKADPEVARKVYKFRLSEGVYIPYLNLEVITPAMIFGDGRRDEIIVSPTNKSELTKQGLEYLLSYNGFCPKVRESKIPFRG